jgi:cytochrome c biogenesis protein CcmG/thiol:disulfide interchange protein DsbE
MSATSSESATASEAAVDLPDESSAADSNRARITLGGLAAISLVLLLLVVVGLGLVRAQAGPVAVGSQAPSVTLTTFDGEQVSLDSLRGQVVVVNFWASWCLPCEDEAAELEAAWQNYQDQGVVFLGVNYVDTEPEAMAYMNRFEISYPSGPDLGTRISQAFRIRGVPETYIISGSGEIVSVMKGPYASQAQIERAIQMAIDS